MKRLLALMLITSSLYAQAPSQPIQAHPVGRGGAIGGAVVAAGVTFIATKFFQYKRDRRIKRDSAKAQILNVPEAMAKAKTKNR